MRLIKLPQPATASDARFGYVNVDQITCIVPRGAGEAAIGLTSGCGFDTALSVDQVLALLGDFAILHTSL